MRGAPSKEASPWLLSPRGEFHKRRSSVFEKPAHVVGPPLGHPLCPRCPGSHRGPCHSCPTPPTSDTNSACRPPCPHAAASQERVLDYLPGPPCWPTTSWLDLHLLGQHTPPCTCCCALGPGTGLFRVAAVPSTNSRCAGPPWPRRLIRGLPLAVWEPRAGAVSPCQNVLPCR